ncbi:MAG: hemolysin III family protein [Candidatus Bipolaricaulia bacterium]
MSNSKRAGPSADLPHYTPGEEIANAVTHGIGTALSIAGTAVLVTLAALHGTVVHIVSFSIYGASLILLHLASTLYHALRPPRAKRVFRVLDHSSIYLLIAGTYTPFLLISLRGSWGITFLVVIWALAIAGIAFQSIFLGRFRRLSVAGYVLMGWLIVIAARQVWLKVPHEALLGIAIGGLLYTLGIAFYAWKRLPYHHAIWHLFVLGGSISHYFAILLYLLPKG